MIQHELFSPNSIAIIGASNNLNKPGGKLLSCLKTTSILIDIFPVNPNKKEVQGLPAYKTIEELPPVDLAIMAIPAESSITVIQKFIRNKSVKVIIIISAGFGEVNKQGKIVEEQLKKMANDANITLIGPNCIGVLAPIYSAMFVSPLPVSTPGGIDFVSASGALAAFIFEQATRFGVYFHSVVSVGNSIQTGVEELLEYWDYSFSANSPRIKLIYAEQIKNPHKFYKHAASLRRKNCHLLVMTPGKSETGKQAIQSHTGALQNKQDDIALLLKKCGAIQCNSRDQLIHTAAVLSTPQPKGKNISIITNAGGPGVLLVDALEKAGYMVPEIPKSLQTQLSKKLPHGASVKNPIDVLATAQIQEVIRILEWLDKDTQTDATIIIYGSTGMENLEIAYANLATCIKKHQKPVYVVFPSVNSASKAIHRFLQEKIPVFYDEVNLAMALGKMNMESPAHCTSLMSPLVYTSKKTMSLLDETKTINWLQKVGINYVPHEILKGTNELYKIREIRYPIVAKSTGILHKTEKEAIIVNIRHLHDLKDAIKHLLGIPESSGVMVQEMLSGIELFAGIKQIKDIGYALYFAQGGTLVELNKSIVSTLLPVTNEELENMVAQFKPQPLLNGFRGMPKVSKPHLVALLSSLVNLVQKHPEIIEMDLNPIIANGESLMVVDARILL